jgi:hypothetical protein
VRGNGSPRSVLHQGNHHRRAENLHASCTNCGGCVLVDNGCGGFSGHSHCEGHSNILVFFRIYLLLYNKLVLLDEDGAGLRKVPCGEATLSLPPTFFLSGADLNERPFFILVLPMAISLVHTLRRSKMEY